jgi:NAD(P)-dependent dehydrogenase (short-subunit alcohol dehydrogenase family)
MTLARRTALVTGANRGIGLATADLLSALGHRVYVTARQFADAERAAASLRDAGRDVIPLGLNVADPENTGAALQQISERGDVVDVLINNAGVLFHTKILDMPATEIAASVAVHLTGPLHLIQRLAPGMCARDYGRIVNVSSGWGSFCEGLGGPDLYGVTKAALNALTLAVSRELPTSVKINALCPGWVRTRMGGESADRSPAEGAETIVWLATLPTDGPTGGFFRDRQPISW